MSGKRKEIWAGAAVFLAAAIAFFLIGTRQSVSGREAGSYLLSARFNQADGLIPGNEVRVAGIKVGKVVRQSLDPHYGVLVTFSMSKKILLPDDSGASIQSDGLFGAKLIEIVPGGSEDMLAEGDTLSFTEDALNIESLLDKVISMAKADRAKKSRCP